MPTSELVRRALVLTCLLLAATAVGSLVLSFQSAEHARQADLRAAINRVLNCVQIAHVHLILEKHGLQARPEPLCEDVDTVTFREGIDRKTRR